MNITFTHRKLCKIVNDDRALFKKFGKIQGKKIKRRLSQLGDAATLEELRGMPGKYHELREDRKSNELVTWISRID